MQNIYRNYKSLVKNISFLLLAVLPTFTAFATDEVPKGYYKNSEGTIVLDSYIQGHDWETVLDKEAQLGHHSPVTVFGCHTNTNEYISLDILKKTNGFYLLYYKGADKTHLNLIAQSHVQDAYYAENLNDYTILFRDSKYWYYFSESENDDDMDLAVINAMTGKSHSNFKCIGNWETQEDFLDQIVPEKFKFKFMTDELEDFLNERFK